jgi:hypothetical protein
MMLGGAVPEHYGTDDFVEFGSKTNVRPVRQNLRRNVLNPSVRAKVPDRKRGRPCLSTSKPGRGITRPFEQLRNTGNEIGRTMTALQHDDNSVTIGASLRALDLIDAIVASDRPKPVTACTAR